MPTTALALPPVRQQAERLIALGVAEIAGLTASELRRLAAVDAPALLVIHPARVAASQLMPHVERDGKPGFVVVDMPDVDEFTASEYAALPDIPAYLVHGIERGDELANRSPNEALPALLARGRSPLTIGEGIHWLLQQPQALERNHCFMTIGSRRHKPGGGLDARTPALWISNGTGRDGAARRGAAKLGWCWAGNRHTWLGFASAGHRSAP